MHQNIVYFFCLCNILIVSIILIEGSEKKRKFPKDFVHEKDEDPIQEKLKTKFDYTITSSTQKIPPKKPEESQQKKIEFVFHHNTSFKPDNKDPQVYFMETTSDPKKPGYSTIRKQKFTNTSEKAMPSFSFSKINTKKSYNEKLSELTQGENTKVCIKCDFCEYKEEDNLLWLAAYNIVAHRKTEHSICGCNKKHQNPKDAYDCTDCQ